MSKTLWAVSVRGPDDLIACADAYSAHKRAHDFNAWWLAHIKKNQLLDNDPHIWASPVEWPYSAETHAASLAKNPYPDYSAAASHPSKGGGTEQ